MSYWGSYMVYIRQYTVGDETIDGIENSSELGIHTMGTTGTMDIMDTMDPVSRSINN